MLAPCYRLDLQTGLYWNFEWQWHFKFDAGSPRVAASALRGWSLLVTSLPQWQLNGAFCSSALGSLSKHLHVNDVAQRDAAGEATALLFSVADLPSLDSDENGSEGNWNMNSWHKKNALMFLRRPACYVLKAWIGMGFWLRGTLVILVQWSLYQWKGVCCKISVQYVQQVSTVREASCIGTVSLLQS